MYRKNIAGTAMAININNGSVNEKWLSVEATSAQFNELYGPNGLDVIAELNNKQDIIDGTTDLTVKSLDIDDASGINVLNFDSGTQASITGTNTQLTFDIAGTQKITLDATDTTIYNNLTCNTDMTIIGDITANTTATTQAFNIITCKSTATITGGAVTDSLKANLAAYVSISDDIVLSGYVINPTGDNVVMGRASNQLIVTGGGNITSDNSLHIKPGYKNTVATDNYITYDPQTSGIHYFLNDVEITGDMSCTNLTATGTANISSITSGNCVFTNNITATNNLVAQNNCTVTNNIQTTGGSIICDVGNIVATAGDIIANNGDMICENQTSTVSITSNGDITSVLDMHVGRSLDIQDSLNQSGTGLIKFNGNVNFKDRFYFNKTLGRIGLNCVSNTPLSSFEVGVGSSSVETTPTNPGTSIGAYNALHPCLVLACAANEYSVIDFKQTGSSTIQSRIAYYDTTKEIAFWTTATDQTLTLSDGLVDAEDSDITTTGDITGGVITGDSITTTGAVTASSFTNLHGSKGQLMAFMGEVTGVLRNGQFDWCFGDARNSSSIWGICVPMEVKIMRFSYQCHNSGTAFTNTGNPATSSVMVQQLWINNNAQPCYAYCNWSDTTNGSVAYYRFSNKVSSSSTSQIDIVGGFSVTGNAGSEFSWKGLTQTNFPTANTGHRFTTIVMTDEDI